MRWCRRSREEEALEARARPEHAVLGPLERRAAGLLGGRVRVERRGSVLGRVVHRHPVVLNGLAVGVQVLDVGREDVRIGLAVVEDDRARVCERRTCSTCSLPPLSRLAGSLGTKRKTKLLGCLACVLTLPFGPPSPRRSRCCRRSRSGCPRSRPGRATPGDASTLDGKSSVAWVRRLGAALGREEQALRERIPGRAVDLRHGCRRRRPASPSASRDARRRRRG